MSNDRVRTQSPRHAKSVLSQTVSPLIILGDAGMCRDLQVIRGQHHGTALWILGSLWSVVEQTARVTPEDA
jgi:hypothetical protein